MSSVSPTKASTGQVMSASVTSRSSITKPPETIRLWTPNCLTTSASAGPGQATQPSASRKRRWRSFGSSASRSWSWRRNWIRWRSDLPGSISRKPVRAAQAGSAVRASTLSARKAAPRVRISSGRPKVSVPRVSTGLPKTTTLAIERLRR